MEVVEMVIVVVETCKHMMVQEILMEEVVTCKCRKEVGICEEKVDEAMCASMVMMGETCKHKVTLAMYASPAVAASIRMGVESYKYKVYQQQQWWLTRRKQKHLEIEANASTPQDLPC
ncbi:hypothetical protein L6452_11254 [Arctium lappa]|uniref:Uncharacterized protein n=1 Tax=Arctium lappa TaxID=4217 RepID=A0ACB9DP79_ARCLA|nr:hypothetical protein L6452_11254 [Arctium lappa]